MSGINIKFLYDYKIDIIKSYAIISVLILHFYPENLLKQVYYQFDIGQCVGVFIILIGLTSLVTFKRCYKRKKLFLKELYSKQYFIDKIKRIILPFLPIVLFSFVIFRSSNMKLIYPISGFLLGRLTIEVPGNYFITLLLQVIIFLPLIFYLYKRYSYGFLIFSLFINFIFELIAPQVNLLTNGNYFYKSCLLRYLFLIVSGLYISDDYWKYKHIPIFQKKYLIFILLLPFSVIYLFIGQFIRQPFPLFDKSWGTINILSYPYAIILTVLLLNLNFKQSLPSIILKIFTIIGKASYHIYLVQLLYFSLLLSKSTNSGIFYQSYLNFILILSCGIFYYYLNNFLLKRTN